MTRRRLRPLIAIAAVSGVVVAASVSGGAAAQDPSPYELPTPTPTPAHRPALLNPMPIVRISGRLTLDGAQVTLLAVKAPALARIVVRCGPRKRGCPTKRSTTVVPDNVRRTVRYRLRRFERTYRDGARLRIVVARRGTIGKYVEFRVRQGRAPKRKDACVLYGQTKPRPCRAG